MPEATRYVGLPAALRRIDEAVEASALRTEVLVELDDLAKDGAWPSEREPREYVWLPNCRLHDGLAPRRAVQILWDFMARQTFLMRLQLENGEKHHIQPEWITPPPDFACEFPSRGLHVDLSFGSLGTGTASWTKGLSGELLAPEPPLERLLARLRSGRDHSASPRAIADRILEAYADGSATTKAEVKALFPSASKRAFEAGWELAKESRPELSRPGPRSSR